MFSTRKTVISVATLGLGLIFACSSSSSNSSSSSGGSSSGTSGTSGTSSGTSGTSGASSGASSGTSGSSGFTQCPGSGTSSCSKADIDTYNNCVLGACDATYKECYGGNYKSGDFSGGACATFIGCTSKCACNDTACTLKCATGPDGGIGIDPACSACSQKLGTCVTGAACTKPACMTTGSSGSSGTSGTSGTSGSSGTTQTCATLQACCDKITDATYKSACQQAHDAASGNDATCSQDYAAFKSFCP